MEAENEGCEEEESKIEWERKGRKAFRWEGEKERKDKGKYNY